MKKSTIRKSSGSSQTFTEGPVLSALLRFSVPVLLALLLQALYGAVDLWAVGKFADTADISAVSTGSQTMLIATGLITGLSTGTMIRLAQKIGQKDSHGAAQTVCASIQILGVLGLFLSILLVFSANFIARLMNTPPEAFSQTVHYIQICGGGSLCIAAYNLLSAVYRGMGDSRSPLIFVLIACLTNIFGDITLIAGFHMGAAGAAAATVAAQAVSVILSCVFICKKGLPFPIHKDHFQFHRKLSLDIIRLGFPIALQDMCSEFSYLFIIGIVNTLGVTISAGVGIAEKLVIFILLIPTCYMQSISAFSAQNVGAGKLHRAKRCLWTGMGTAVFLGGIAAYVSYFHGDVLSLLFLGDTAGSDAALVIASSAEFLKATSIECFVLSIAYCLTGYFNGLGKTAFVMAQGLISIFLIRMPFAWFAGHRSSPRLFYIALATAFSAIFTLVVCLIYYAILDIREARGES